MVSTRTNITQSERDGGREFHVADCYIWAEIYYLDSPTDYREYLPLKDVSIQSKPCSEQMVLLDDQRGPTFFRSSAKFFFYSSIVTFAVLCVIALCRIR